MRYKKISEQDISFLKMICGEKHVFIKEKNIHEFAGEDLTNVIFMPEVVVEPRTSEAVSDILRYAYENNISVTPRYKGKGLIWGILINMSKVNMNSKVR